MLLHTSQGSGKSALLLALLGELRTLSGRVWRHPTGLGPPLAYVPQRAWIKNATVSGALYS
jgi:ABC-type Mn2+/Zn2+ transport system ATPase subunit